MKKFIYLLLLVLVFQSCENENLSEDQEISSSSADITNDEPNNFELQSLTIKDLPSLKQNIDYAIENSTISWSKVANSENIILDSQGVLQVLDSIGNYSYAVRMSVPESPYNVFYNVVVKKDNAGNFKQPMVLRYEVDESYYPTYSSSDRKEAPFRGDIAYYGLGSFASSSISGKEAAPVPCGSISVAGTSGNNSNGSSGSGSGGGGSSTSTEGDNYTNISTPSYVYVAIDSAPSTTPKLTPSVEVGIGTWPETEHNDPKGSGEGPCGEAYKAPGGACKYLGSDCPEEELVFPINESEDHVHLEDEVNNPCVKNILQKLQRKNMKKLTVPEIGDLDGTGHLSQGILDLFDGFDNLDLTFKIDEAGTNKNAFTKTNVSGGNVGIFVTLDEEFVENGTQLAIARTIIHESVHAYLEYVTGNYSQSETAILLNEYRKQNDGSKNIAQHQFMSEFAEAIGASLSVWDNNSQSPEYYNYLAWSGDMTKSDTFKGLQANVQKAIVSANIAEGSAVSGSTNNAKGKKCKD